MLATKIHYIVSCDGYSNQLAMSNPGYCWLLYDKETKCAIDQSVYKPHVI